METNDPFLHDLYKIIMVGMSWFCSGLQESRGGGATPMK